MTIRIIVRQSDEGAARHVGGPVQTRHKTFDVELPELEQFLRAEGQPTEPPGCARGEWFFVKGDWRGAAKDFHPTHWQPLPSPPSMDGAVQAATSGGALE